MGGRLVKREYCPIHRVFLNDGPVLYRCPEGHTVWDADLDHEFRPAVTS